jgi:hypothetical protein
VAALLPGDEAHPSVAERSIFLVVAVLATAGFVEFVGVFSDLVFEFLWFVYRGW